jgi:hypothetical protein
MVVGPRITMGPTGVSVVVVVVTVGGRVNLYDVGAGFSSGRGLSGLSPEGVLCGRRSKQRVAIITGGSALPDKMPKDERLALGIRKAN